MTVPGQRKRKRRVREEYERAAAAVAGWRWEVLYETEDSAEVRARLHALAEERPEVDLRHVRVDTWCGRFPSPPFYRVSVLVPPDATE
ncbi:hypothetical protein [Streptomyces sp. NPDC088733]|uniref:hypothetical protein n=1 Tax=Streptomyces sp. NPDC088733 TaxID=3365880 RepID=UPI0037F996E0